MWVRSQDRKILTEIHDLDIDDINQIWDGSSLLGKYSTEEKALKVLDEINSLLNATEFDVSNLPIVFEMPLDEDVEV